MQYLINTIKWAVPGVMLYDGCRSQQRVKVALLAVAGVYLFLGLMVIKVMPIRAVMMSGTDLQRVALKLLISRVGLHRVTLSMMLAGGSWAILSLRGLTTDRRLRVVAIGLFFIVFYAQALTGGACRLPHVGHHRSDVVFSPVARLPARRPSRRGDIAARRTQRRRSVDGRHFAQRLQFQHRRQRLRRHRRAQRHLAARHRKDRTQHVGGLRENGDVATGIVAYASKVLAEDFGHPHNAYLEWLLDNGILGFIPVMLFYIVSLFHALRLFCDRRSGLFMAAGGTAAAHILALLGASMGSQSFYPIEGTVGMWCAIGIMLRVSVNRTQALAAIAAEEQAAGRTLALAVRQPAVAAASIEALMWPAAKAVFPAQKKSPSTAAPVPLVPRATTPRATTPRATTPRGVRRGQSRELGPPRRQEPSPTRLRGPTSRSQDAAERALAGRPKVPGVRPALCSCAS